MSLNLESIFLVTPDRIQDFVDLVTSLAVAKEREACAHVCESHYMGDNNREDMEAQRCASAIRKRNQT